MTAVVPRYEFSHTTDRLWRKNRNPNPGTFGFCPGVDLNRNFGYKWGHEVRSRDTRLLSVRVSIINGASGPLLFMCCAVA